MANKTRVKPKTPQKTAKKNPTRAKPKLPKGRVAKPSSVAATPHADADQQALRQLREGIDAADDQIIELLNGRARLAQQIGKIKARRSERFYVPERERQVLARLLSKSQGPLSADSMRLIYKEIISASLALESPLEVVYLGPEATFTHEATKRHFGMSARLRPTRTIADVFADVSRGRCEYGVVPIESSSEGVVSSTLDMFAASDLQICAEVLLEGNYHLLTSSGQMQGVTKVYAHAESVAPCIPWLKAHLAGVPVVDVPSTSRAAQLAAEDTTAAALGTELAASLYGLQVAATSLEEHSGTLTRFLVIGHDHPKPTGRDRTSIMFSLKDTPGILFKALAPFAAAGINMSRIESRPSRQQAWEYMFFIDLDGHRDDDAVAHGLKILQDMCVFFKVLGSYPQGELGGGTATRRRSDQRSPS